jgi:hypothetical protein
MIRLLVYRLIEFGRRVYRVLVYGLCTSNTELCRPTGLCHFLDSIVYGERLPVQAGDLVTEES